MKFQEFLEREKSISTRRLKRYSPNSFSHPMAKANLQLLKVIEVLKSQRDGLIMAQERPGSSVGHYYEVMDGEIEVIINDSL